MDAGLIEGLLVTPERRLESPKGDVLRAIKRSSPGFVGFGETYFSTVHEGVIKGWRRHNRVTLNLVVPVGRIRFVLHDDRLGSASHGRFSDVTLGGPHHARLTVPPGLWMAFQGLGTGTSVLLNLIDEEHDPTESNTVEIDAFRFDFAVRP